MKWQYFVLMFSRNQYEQPQKNADTNYLKGMAYALQNEQSMFDLD